MEDSSPFFSHLGINRLQYFLSSVALILVLVIVVSFVGIYGTVGSVCRFLLIAGGFVAGVFRLRSIGVSQWFALLLLVPVVNIFLGIFVQSAQPGWAETRRFDRVGRFLIGLHVFLYLLIFVMVLTFTFNSSVVIP